MNKKLSILLLALVAMTAINNTNVKACGLLRGLFCGGCGFSSRCAYTTSYAPCTASYGSCATVATPSPCESVTTACEVVDTPPAAPCAPVADVPPCAPTTETVETCATGTCPNVSAPVRRSACPTCPNGSCGRVRFGWF